MPFIGESNYTKLRYGVLRRVTGTPFEITNLFSSSPSIPTTSAVLEALFEPEVDIAASRRVGQSAILLIKLLPPSRPT